MLLTFGTLAAVRAPPDPNKLRFFVFTRFLSTAIFRWDSWTTNIFRGFGGLAGRRAGGLHGGLAGRLWRAGPSNSTSWHVNEQAATPTGANLSTPDITGPQTSADITAKHIVHSADITGG